MDRRTSALAIPALAAYNATALVKTVDYRCGTALASFRQILDARGEPSNVFMC